MKTKEGMYQAAISRCKKLEDEITCLRDELAEAKKIIDRLPKTADGVAVVPNDVVYVPTKKGIFRCLVVFDDVDISNRSFAYSKANIVVYDGITCQAKFAMTYCYSTRQAAEAARGGGE